MLVWYFLATVLKTRQMHPKRILTVADHSDLIPRNEMSEFLYHCYMTHFRWLQQETPTKSLDPAL